jgi:hypothetical protein
MLVSSTLNLPKLSAIVPRAVAVAVAAGEDVEVAVDIVSVQIS